MPVVTQLRIKYSDLFDDPPLPFEDYFIGASEENLLMSIPLLVNLSSPEGNKDAIALVNEWFSPANNNIKQAILSKLNQGDAITSIISSLKLTEYITTNQFGPNQTISDADFLPAAADYRHSLAHKSLRLRRCFQNDIQEK